MPNIDLSILNQRQTPAFYADTLANRPAAGFIGRIFVSTNTFAFYRDNGTGWDLIGGPGTGTITGSGATGQIALWDGASTITGDSGLTYNGTDNSLTASKFIVTGGTSSQFLKGDGSLDSSAYVTTNIYNGNGTLSAERTISLNNFNLIFDGGATTARVRLDADTNVARIFSFATNNLPRFAIRVDGTESGGNTGSDYAIRRYDDAGTFVDAPLTITRSTGQSTFAKKVVIENNAGDQQLQIVSTTAPSLRIDNLQTGATKRAGLGISTAGNNFIQGSADQDFCIFNGTTISASPILFGIYDAGLTNIQEAARISAARNFLVGTKVDSGQKLIVNGTALISNSLLLGETGVTNAVINSNDGMYFNIDSDSSGGTPEFMFGKQRNGSGSGGTTFMTISNAGNVGINTITPTAAKLVVLSSDTTITMFGQNIDSSTTLGNAFVSRFRNGFDGNGLYSLTSFQVQNAAGTDQISFIGAQSVTGAGNYSPNTVIGVRSGASTFAEYMRIVGSTGNLLIGTTTDNGSKLQVNGTINATTYLGNKILGINYPITSSSGTTAIFDTGIYKLTTNIGYSLGSIYQLQIVANPNSSGSAEYRAIFFGYIYLNTGFSGAVETNIVYSQIVNGNAPGIGALTVSVVLWNGSAEYTSITSSATDAQIRVKIAGYTSGTVGDYTEVRLIKII
jgi:hypothetical protein